MFIFHYLIFLALHLDLLHPGFPSINLFDNLISVAISGLENFTGFLISEFGQFIISVSLKLESFNTIFKLENIHLSVLLLKLSVNHFLAIYDSFIVP